jgi:hypothetical protein
VPPPPVPRLRSPTRPAPPPGVATVRSKNRRDEAWWSSFLPVLPAACMIPSDQTTGLASLDLGSIKSHLRLLCVLAPPTLRRRRNPNGIRNDFSRRFMRRPGLLPSARMRPSVAEFGTRRPAHHRQALAAAAGGLVLALGLTAGIGWVLSEVLVTVFTGVFDPPPGALTIPWLYLAAVTVRAASVSPQPQPSGKPTSHRSVSCANSGSTTVMAAGSPRADQPGTRAGWAANQPRRWPAARRAASWSSASPDPAQADWCRP